MQCNTGTVINLGSLYSLFQRLGDKRKPKGKRYALATILLGMFLAKLCGEDKPSGIAEWVALRGEWIASVLGLKRKSMPSHHTYRRILADVVDEEEFEKLTREYFRHRGEAGYQVVVSMDGKVIRGTIDTEASDGLCLLAAYLPGEGVTLAQVAIESKRNEISAAPRLLGYVDLRNKVVIGDALHTQRQVSIQIDFAWLKPTSARNLGMPSSSQPMVLPVDEPAQAARHRQLLSDMRLGSRRGPGCARVDLGRRDREGLRLRAEGDEEGRGGGTDFFTGYTRSRAGEGGSRLSVRHVRWLPRHELDAPQRQVVVVDAR